MTSRMPSIESFRVLAIFAVILWHTRFVSHLSSFVDGYFPIVLTGYLVWWVGVPYFFLTAGYFFHRSVLSDGQPIAQLRRYVVPLTWVFLGWMCVYVTVPPGWPAEISQQGFWQTFYSIALKNLHVLATDHINLFLQGRAPVFHLWFLPALMFSLAVLAFVTIWKLQRYLIFLIICLYVLAVTEEMAGANSTLHFGTWSIGLLLTAMGWLAAKREPPSATVAWSLIIGGYAIALMEGTVMHTFFHLSLKDLMWHFFLGGIVLGLGIFLLALARPTFGHSTPFPFLAQFTLGVYVSHILVRDSISPLTATLPGYGPIKGAVLAVLVYVLSVLLTIALARVPVVKHLVMKPARTSRAEGSGRLGKGLKRNMDSEHSQRKDRRELVGSGM